LVIVQEDGIEVLPDHSISVGECLCDRINRINFGSVVTIWLHIARENRMEEDLCLRVFHEPVKNGLDSLRDHFGGLISVSNVVRANQHHDDFRLNIDDLTLINAPQNVLRAIRTNPKVCGFVTRELGLENRLTRTLPTLGD
jgi:hypothetical protein